MRKEHPSSQQGVSLPSGKLFKSLQQLVVDATRPELINKLVIVNRELFSVGRDATLDIEGCYKLICLGGVHRWLLEVAGCY